MRRRIFVLSLLTGALVLLLTGCGKPKTYFTLVTGTVISNTDRPVYSAKVAFQTDSSVVSAFTDENGYYSISVPSGQANLIVSKAGYIEHHSPEPLVLENNGHLTQNVTLTVVTPSVTIEGEVSLE